MSVNVARELAALPRMTVKELRQRYAEVFGEETKANNKAWLVKRILWRLQALAEGDLSERARQRAAELANDADLQMNPSRVPVAASAAAAEPQAGHAADRAGAGATRLVEQAVDELQGPPRATSAAASRSRRPTCTTC